MRPILCLFALFFAVPAWAEDPIKEPAVGTTPWGAIALSIIVFIILVLGILVQKRWAD